MVKIDLLIIDHSRIIGGAEKVILNIIKGLRPKGIMAGVACSPSAYKFIKLIKENGGEVFKLRTGEEAEKWRGLNLLNPFMLLYLFRMRNFIKKIKLQYGDIPVLVQMYKEQILSGLGRKDGILWSQHPHPPFWLTISPLRYIYAAIANGHVSKIITCSASVKKALVRIGIKKDKVRVIPNGLDIPDNIQGNRASVDFCRWYNISSQTRVISTHSRLHPEKGQNYLLMAIRELVSEFPSMKVIIMGEGRYRSYLEQLTLALNLTEHVIFTGYYDYSRLSEILAITDIWISPSLNESFSLSILEAMAQARPVIATSVGGTNELIKDGYDGKLISPADVKSIVRAARELLGHPEKAREMGRRARQKIINYYSFDKFLDNFLECIYEKDRIY